MKRILLVGIPAEVGPWLESRLPGASARAVGAGESWQNLLDRESHDLLLLDHGFGPSHGVELLERLRGQGALLPPIFYSLPDLGDFALMFRLIQELRVQRLLVHPLDPEELLGRISEFLSLPKANAPRPRVVRPSLSPAMEKLWQKHLPSLLERARRVAEASDLDNLANRREIQRCAHQLAGTVGSFGLQRATDLAREAEGLLMAETGQPDVAEVRRLGTEVLAMLDGEEGVPSAPPVEAAPADLEDNAAQPLDTWGERLGVLQRAAMTLVQGQIHPEMLRLARAEAQRLRTAASVFRWPQVCQRAREVEELLARDSLGAESAASLAERVRSLRADIERSALPQLSGGGKTVLLPDRSGPLWKDLELALHLQGLHSCRASGATLLAPPTAQAALLEFDPAEGEALFQALDTFRERDIPCLIYAEKANLSDKVRLASLGVRGFLERDIPTAEVLTLVKELLNGSVEARGRILAVDDDPLLLKVLERTLGAAGFQVSTEAEPLLFWERLQEVDPDLVLLDLDMPRLSGVELCRVLRGDSRWGGVPVVFLTAEREATAVERIFAAGGDDYVLKPLVGPELLNRIDYRLTRFQRGWSAMQSGRQGDRRAAEARLEWLLQLAGRLQQSLSFAMLQLPKIPAPGQDLLSLERRLREACLPGDVVLRWNGQAALWALFGCGPQEARARLEAALHQEPPVLSALACFPGDGSRLESLLERLEAGIRSSEAGVSPNRESVVLIDDDPTVADLVRGILEPQGMSVLCLENCAQARARLLTEEVGARVILLDVGLPDGDGYELLRELSQSPGAGGSRIIMLTGESNAPQKVFQAIEQGAFDYISKPFQAWVLAARVRRAWANAG